jgi:peptidoglycan/xylan/chitin deacetylase (PgdA/CDA1 family)
MESAYEYGARVGVWRLLQIFRDRRVPFTVCTVGMALERNPKATEAMAAAGVDFVDHGWRWINYQSVDEATEREHAWSKQSGGSPETGRSADMSARPDRTRHGSSSRRAASSTTATPTMTSCHVGIISMAGRI